MRGKIGATPAIAAMVVQEPREAGGHRRLQETSEEPDMNLRRLLLSTAAAVGFAALLTAPAPVLAQVRIDNNSIGGVVNGPNGPEAGVWVFAETADLGTRYAKMVV